MDNKIIKLIAFVKVSQYRTKVLIAIGENLIFPSEIAKKVDIRINYVSKTLKELKNSNLVICVNEDAKKGRLYKTTEEGKKVIKELTKKSYL
jgi:DNA-binding MarR family transcriptional regulator